MQYRTIRLVLGDQLNINHAWFQRVEPDVLYVIAELHQETRYVKHHIQKVCAFFMAMESFAHQLSEEGHQVLHLTLDDTVQFQDLPNLLEDLWQRYQCEEFHYQRPDEHRLLTQLRALDPLEVQIVEYDTGHFFLPFDEISDYFTAGKHVLMENFYRKMRKRFNVLMTDSSQPMGGQWNYDSDNRHSLKKSDLAAVPSPLCFDNNASEVIERLNRHNVVTFGHVGTHLLWSINRAQALNLLAFFCEYCLVNFGRFEDAMTDQITSKWSLYHSRISFALNTKLLSPREVVSTVIDYYEQNKKTITLAQVEGFVRQILGWREYVRGVYWANMPNYQQHNQLNAKRSLPHYFWSGDTKMNCVAQAVSQSLTQAYAHHIQRLMVTGNFALLAGISPDEVDAWYLGIYIDAIEWVEMPNTRGMALFADGGIVATKPYIASGAYINKMSDYCRSCHYQVKEKLGAKACPFNSLYWAFLSLHREHLANNHRLKMMYSVWDKMAAEQQQAILDTAQNHLIHIESI